MKKNVFGKQLKRDTNERKALFKNLLTSLVLNERIKTTEAKAKAIRSAADKLITKAKKGGDVAYRGLDGKVNRSAVVKLVEDLGPRFVSRDGGYTRIVKIGSRVADNAPMVMMEWTERASASVKAEGKKQSAKGNDKKAKESKSAKVKKEAAPKTLKQPKNLGKSADVKQVRSAAGRKTG